MLKKNHGFSILQIIIALGLLSLLSLMFMHLVKNMGNAQHFAQSKADELELKNSLRMVLNNERHCRVSLAGDGPIGNPSTPVIIKKTNVDEDGEGLDIALYLANQSGDARSAKKYNGKVNNPGGADKSKFGKIIIKTIKLLMNNGTGSDYSDSDLHSDIGVVRVEVEKTLDNGQTRTTTLDLDINVTMSTGKSPEASGETRILSCTGKSDNGVPSGAVMAFHLTSCPPGFVEYTPAYGRFIRGVDRSGSNIDLDGERVIGNVQGDTVKEHTHDVTSYYNNCNSIDEGNDDKRGFCRSSTRTTKTYESTIPKTGSSLESRPKNVSLLYCKKV